MDFEIGETYTVEYKYKKSFAVCQVIYKNNTPMAKSYNVYRGGSLEITINDEKELEYFKTAYQKSADLSSAMFSECEVLEFWDSGCAFDTIYYDDDFQNAIYDIMTHKFEMEYYENKIEQLKYCMHRDFEAYLSGDDVLEEDDEDEMDLDVDTYVEDWYHFMKKFKKDGFNKENGWSVETFYVIHDGFDVIEEGNQ